jgi:hypothetical protein
MCEELLGVQVQGNHAGCPDRSVRVEWHVAEPGWSASVIRETARWRGGAKQNAMTEMFAKAGEPYLRTSFRRFIPD